MFSIFEFFERISIPMKNFGSQWKACALTQNVPMNARTRHRKLDCIQDGPSQAQLRPTFQRDNFQTKNCKKCSFE